MSEVTKYPESTRTNEYSLLAFKEISNAKSLIVSTLDNEQGTRVFECGSRKGIVSPKMDLTKPAQVLEMTEDESGSVSYVLCNSGTTATVTATL